MLLEYIMETFDGVIIDDYDILHYKIKGKKYDITYDEDRKEWSCDCPAAKWHKKSVENGCKHILESKLKRSNWIKNGKNKRRNTCNN